MLQTISLSSRIQFGISFQTTFTTPTPVTNAGRALQGSAIRSLLWNCQQFELPAIPQQRFAPFQSLPQKKILINQIYAQHKQIILPKQKSLNNKFNDISKNQTYTTIMITSQKQILYV